MTKNIINTIDQQLIKKFKKNQNGLELSRDRFDHFIKLIDTNLARCIVLGVSRFDVLWGIPSAEMNREIRKYSCERSIKLFVYWTISSQLLEAKYKNIGVIKKRKELREYKKEISMV